ncbi:hypothetical protein QBC38DRAFT_500481 [Podospora fimiseda]|uniref:Rhodopsin domain-containing protein n=1 Tax=Podospora fimiseda TaxID=252190 RepID=A0AAN7BMV9_9PEZI|nr:hypothetical protein QBC38DRAFT_500481 [Podospora fimiseda]
MVYLYLDQRQDFTANTSTTPEYCDLRRLGLIHGPPPDLGPSTAVIIWTLLAISSIFVTLRIYCKIWRSRGLWWDDWVLIASWFCFLGKAIMCQRVFNHGFGRYPCDVPPQNLTKIALQGAGLGAVFSILAIVWSKTSFALTIIRITTGKVRAFVIALAITMNIAMSLQAIFVWVKCMPVQKNWNPMLPGTCWNTKVSNAYGVFSGSLSGVCDIVLALLAWYVVWGLKMKRREKIGVVVAMSMGIFAGITAFVKASKILILGGKNFTYEGCALLAWTAAEISTTIMASCIPVLRVLFRELRDGSVRRHRWNGIGSYKLTRSGGTSSGQKSRGTGRRSHSATGGPGRAGASQWGMDFERIVSREELEVEGNGVEKGKPRVKIGASGNVSRGRSAAGSGQQVLMELPAERSASRNLGVIVQTQEFEVRYEEPNSDQRNIVGRSGQI